MKPSITFLTLGVDDLEASLRFYRDGLGLKTDGIIGTEFEYGAVAFFQFASGLTFALFPRTSLARDAGLPPGPRSATEFSIGHNVRTPEEVDEVMEQARLRRCRHRQGSAKDLLGRLRGLLPGPGRTFVGDRLEPENATG